MRMRAHARPCVLQTDNCAVIVTSFGVLIGFGTRLAGGCTSGHGIFGIANGERASFRAVAAFMLAGVVTTNLVYRVILGVS